MQRFGGHRQRQYGFFGQFVRHETGWDTTDRGHTYRDHTDVNALRAVPTNHSNSSYGRCTKCSERLRSGGSTVKRRREGTPVGNRTSLTPDHAFLVEKIIDDFDAITHLRLCALGHGNDRSADLPRFDIIKRRDAFRP